MVIERYISSAVHALLQLNLRNVAIRSYLIDSHLHLYSFSSHGFLSMALFVRDRAQGKGGLIKECNWRL